MKHVVWILLVATSFSGISFAQRKGIVGAIKDTVQLPSEKFPVTRGDLPSSKSLIDFMPAIRSQGDIGSCVSWSVVYGAMSIVKRIEKADYEERPYSPIRVHSAYKLYYDSLCKEYTGKSYANWYCYLANCPSGAHTFEILSRVEQYGAPKTYLEENQYMCYTDRPQYTVYPDKIYDFKSIDVKVEDLKKALLLNSPLVIVIDYYKGLCWADDQHFDEGVWDGVNKGELDGGHAMIIVGYDDAKAGGAFHVVNSWGDDFGQDGTFWIKYSDINKIDRAYRIVLDPSKNNELDKVSYPSGVLSGEELEEGGKDVIHTSKTFALVSGKGNNAYLWDVNNKKLYLQQGWSHLQYSQKNKTLIGLENTANKIAMISGFKGEEISGENVNLSSLGPDRKQEFVIPNGIQVKSLNLLNKWSNQDSKYPQILVISMANRGYLLDTYTGKMTEVLKPNFRNRKKGYKNFYYNVVKNEVIAITSKNGIIVLNLYNQKKTVYQDNILTFDSEQLYGLAGDVVLLLNQEKSMLVKLSSSSNGKKQFPLFKQKISVITNDLDFGQPINSVLITDNYDYFYAAGNTVYKRDFTSKEYKSLRVSNTSKVETLKWFSTKNALLIGTQNSIIVYDIKKNKQIKEYKKISALLGVTESGFVLAKDQNNRTITIDLNWIY